MPGPVGLADVRPSPGTGPAGRGRACRPALPAPGCTTRPAGLSTTTTSSSAWTTPNSTSASGDQLPASGRRRARRPRPRSPSSTRVEPRGHRPPVDATPPRGDQLAGLGPAHARSAGRRPGRAAPRRAPGDRLPDLAHGSEAAAVPDVPDSSSDATSRSTAPHVMAMSATLNTGHHCRSMKSTTRPRQQPVVGPEDPVGEVAERAAEHQPEGDRARAVSRSTGRTRPAEHHRDGEQRDQRRPARRRARTRRRC